MARVEPLVDRGCTQAQSPGKLRVGAQSLQKFRRAREGGQDGSANGCWAISAQRLIFLATRIWRTWDRACILGIFSQKFSQVRALGQDQVLTRKRSGSDFFRLLDLTAFTS
jgi:hypothetical protein